MIYPDRLALISKLHPKRNRKVVLVVVVVGVVAVAGAVAVPVAVAAAVAVAVKATVAVKLGWRGMAGGMEVVMGGTSNQVQPPAQHSLRPACQMADPREQRQQRTDDPIRGEAGA